MGAGVERGALDEVARGRADHGGAESPQACDNKEGGALHLDIEDAELFEGVDPLGRLGVEGVVAGIDAAVYLRLGARSLFESDSLELKCDREVGHGRVAGVRVGRGRAVVSQRALANEQIARHNPGLQAGG